MAHLNVSRSIFENALSLFKSCEILSKKGQKYHAAHFAALSIEECSKCLMYLPEIRNRLGKKDDQSHFKKEKMIGFLYYITGMLTVAYRLRVAFDKGLLGGNKSSFRRVERDLLEFAGIYKGKKLTAALERYLENRKSINDKVQIFTLNEIRKNTIYVDMIDSELKIPQSRVSDEDIKKVIMKARFVAEFLRMILHKKFSWADFWAAVFAENKNLQFETEDFSWLDIKNNISSHC